MKTKLCTKCGKRKLETDFYRNKSCKDGYVSACKECARAYAKSRRRKYYLEHLNEHKAYYKKYYALHPQKHSRSYARKYYKEHKEYFAKYRRSDVAKACRVAARHNRRSNGNYYLTANMIMEVRNAGTGICPYCNKPFTDGHIDHIIPLSKGGTSYRSNLCYVCIRCNLRKGSMSLDKFLTLLHKEKGN